MFRALILVAFFAHNSFGLKPIKIVSPTKGEVWPKVQEETKLTTYYIIKPTSFIFEPPENISCPNFLNDALNRYYKILKLTAKQSLEFVEKDVKDDDFLGYLDKLTIAVDDANCTEDILPKLNDDESYTVSIDENGATLSGQTIWGVLHGLETFSQLVYSDDDYLFVNATSINDYPRFTHRGLMMDTSRHFFPKSTILQMLDAMAYNKFNVFHWHITDDQSFPYKSVKYPELSDQGAYHPYEAVYEQNDIKEVIEHARLRGIRVVPEFDVPGHTWSWGAAHPEILTPCYEDGKASGELGSMDPSNNATYDFVFSLFDEVSKVFPDSFFHIGGDEVDFDCWKTNPDITDYMKDNGISTYEELQNSFIVKVLNFLNSIDTKYLAWQEVFTNGASLYENGVVHVWKNNGNETLKDVLSSGTHAIYSSCWYLSQLKSGSDWDGFYECDPLEAVTDDDSKKLFLGGEACMWGEYVNELSIMPRVWPRASAVAERLWSSEKVNKADDAKSRMVEHACRMNKRGISAQPATGPGHCT